MFEEGKIYNRVRDIHAVYGGQRQGGISTPPGAPFIFLFQSASGEQHGYTDGWDPEGSGAYVYTGEGQRGDMGFARGNLAVRDHAENGKDLLLFQSLGHGAGYRFLGTFACGSWEYRQGLDTNGNPRRVIVFHLIPLGTDVANETPPTAEFQASTPQLRDRAYIAARGATEGGVNQASRTYYARSEAVRAYVLARAGGLCEGCQQAAPFQRPDGSPYLEPHHIRRVSDGGPDHPRWVAALCPNCHREVHHGMHGKDKNDELGRRVGELEEVSV